MNVNKHNKWTTNIYCFDWNKIEILTNNEWMHCTSLLKDVHLKMMWKVYIQIKKKSLHFEELCNKVAKK